MQGIPQEYQDLADIFNKSGLDELPPHQSTDYAIEIFPGAKLPKQKVYYMNTYGVDEQCAFIDKNLEFGFTEHARSKVAAPVLF